MHPAKTSKHRVDGETLQAIAAQILKAAGALEDKADVVAGHLVEAEIAGRTAHGVRLVDLYVDRLLSGQVNGTATPAVLADRGALLRIDGCRAFGQVAGEIAVRLGVEKAKALGACVVALGNAGHLGRNARWAEMAAEEGIASLHFVHGFAKTASVVPFGGLEARLGTNPIAVGIPSVDGDHLIHDFSTAEISANGVRLAYERGDRLPAPSVIGADGYATDDPTPFVEAGAAIRAFGEYKGFGLGLACEILGGVVAGGSDRGPGVNSMLSFYLDPSRITDQDRYLSEMRDLVASIRATRVADGAPAVSFPGDRSRRSRRQNREGGVLCGREMHASLANAARKCGASQTLAERWPVLFQAEHV